MRNAAGRLSGVAEREDRAAAGAIGRWSAWLPMLLFPTAVLFAAPHLTRWLFMWLLAFAIYAGLKWLTLWQAWRSRREGGLLRSAAYLLGWPGMDARAFLDRSARPAPTRASEWMAGLLKMGLGAIFLWIGVPVLSRYGVLVTGWTGLVGLILLLHFGTFHLASLFWRSLGIRAMPIMRAPLAATSVSDLWGRRWNLAFHTLARDLVVAPLRETIGVPAATLCAFALSGLVHDLVISVPAGGGYGLPTAYFLLQAGALLLERSAAGRHLGLGRGVRGRVFAVAVVAGPAFFLFHPPFIEHVVIPFLQAIHAL